MMTGAQKAVVYIFALLAAVAAVFIIGEQISRDAERSSEQKIACIEAGGVWTSSGCAWSAGAS